MVLGDVRELVLVTVKLWKDFGLIYGDTIG